MEAIHSSPIVEVNNDHENAEEDHGNINSGTKNPGSSSGNSDGDIKITVVDRCPELEEGEAKSTAPPPDAAKIVQAPPPAPSASADLGSSSLVGSSGAASSSFEDDDDIIVEKIIPVNVAERTLKQLQELRELRRKLFGEEDFGASTISRLAVKRRRIENHNERDDLVSDSDLEVDVD